MISIDAPRPLHVPFSAQPRASWKSCAPFPKIATIECGTSGIEIPATGTVLTTVEEGTTGTIRAVDTTTVTATMETIMAVATVGTLLAATIIGVVVRRVPTSTAGHSRRKKGPTGLNLWTFVLPQTDPSRA